MKNIITTRLSQLLSRFIMAVSASATGVFGKAAYIDEATALEIAGVIVSGLVTLGAAAWELYIHSKKTGSIMAPAAPTPPKENT